MAFFKSFQQSLPSVSSLLDTVSNTVSTAVDDLSSAVSDVTYTVSDQLTEQVNTIINKVQTEEDDKKDAEGSSEEVQKERRNNKLKRQETEGNAADIGEGEGRKSRKSKKNSMWTIEIDEQEVQREKERQEEARKAEEEEWEWCHTPSKGWYRKRRDPNQPQSLPPTSDNQKENSDQASKGAESVTQEENASSSGKHKNEGGNHNENANGMHPGNSQDSQDISGDTDISASKHEKNGEHNRVEEDGTGRSKDKGGKGENVCWTCHVMLFGRDGSISLVLFGFSSFSLFYTSLQPWTHKCIFLFIIFAVLLLTRAVIMGELPGKCSCDQDGPLDLSMVVFPVPEYSQPKN